MDEMCWSSRVEGRFTYPGDRDVAEGDPSDTPVLHKMRPGYSALAAWLRIASWSNA